MYDRQKVDVVTILNFITEEFDRNPPFPGCSAVIKIVRTEPDETGNNWTIGEESGIETLARYPPLTLEAQEISKNKLGDIITEAYCKFNLEDE